MPAYNYSNDEFPEQDYVQERLTWYQLFGLGVQVGIAVPRFFTGLLTYPISGKTTGPIATAFANSARGVISSLGKDDTMQKCTLFQPLEKTMNILRSYYSTRHYNVRFTEATKSISRWIYEKEGRSKDDPVMVFIHGGGFETKALLDHIIHVHNICKNTGISAMMVDYGTVPYYKFPTQLDECLDTIKALHQTCNKIIIAGDSAGGNLTAACALKLKDLGTPAWGLYVSAPWVQLYPRDIGSWVNNANLDWITAPWLQKAALLYLDHGKFDTNKYAQPYLASVKDWKGAMPKNSILVYGKCELFADQCEQLGETAGITSIYAEPKGIHDFNIVLEKSGKANEFIYATIKTWLE